MFTAKHISSKSGGKRRSTQTHRYSSEIRELQRSERSFTELAQNETWLADNFDKIIRFARLRHAGRSRGKAH